MTRKRQIYTREFKIEAVRLVTEEGYSIREAAESLGVSDNANCIDENRIYIVQRPNISEWF